MDSISADEPTFAQPQRNYAILLLANFLWFIALGLYYNFLTIYVRGLGANPIEVGIFISVFATSALIFTGLSGPLTNRFGEKPILIFSWCIIIPAPIIYLFAPTWQWTLLGAFFEGFSMLAIPPMRTYIRYVTGTKRRGLGYALIISSSMIAWIPAPLIGGFLITLIGYHVVFLLATLFYTISSVCILFISPVPRLPKDQPQNHARGFLSNRTFLFATLFSVVIVSIQTFANMFIPLFLTDNFGLQEDVIGILYSLYYGSGAVIGPLLSMAGDRWGFTKILPINVSSYFVTIGFLVILPSSLLIAPLFILWGCFTGTYSMVNALISHHVPLNQLPNAFAFYTFFQRILTPLTPFLGGLTYNINPALPLVTSFLLFPVPLIILLVLHRTQKATPLRK